MKKYLIYPILCLSLVPGVAQAGIVEKLCEGHIPCSFDQFKAGENDWFKRADTNHDGKVDAQEQAAIWQSSLQDILPNCKDAQSLFVLKLNHIPSDDQMHQTFNKIDLNGDGQLDATEDKQATARIDATCQMMHDPQMQKTMQMMQQMQQNRANSKAAAPATTEPAQ